MKKHALHKVTMSRFIPSAIDKFLVDKATDATGSYAYMASIAPQQFQSGISSSSIPKTLFIALQEMLYSCAVE